MLKDYKPFEAEIPFLFDLFGLHVKAYKVIYLFLFFLILLIRMTNVTNWKSEKKGIKMKKKEKKDFFELYIGTSAVMLGNFFIPIIVIFTPFLDAYKIGISKLPSWFYFCFCGLFLFACYLFHRSHSDLGKNWSPLVELREKQKVIRHGVYKYIRHPMYASSWLYILMQGLITDNLVLEILGTFGWGLLYFTRIPKEEKMMVDQFGEDYVKYMKETGRVFPKLF